MEEEAFIVKIGNGFNQALGARFVVVVVVEVLVVVVVVVVVVGGVDVPT